MPFYSVAGLVRDIYNPTAHSTELPWRLAQVDEENAVDVFISAVMRLLRPLFVYYVRDGVTGEEMRGICEMVG